jgi:HD superfamily phosphohydrolase
MKIIKDPVHGYVEVNARILPLLDSPPVQRLRYVRQLGFSHLVYPGANHTRFEHSLGTMHLARLLCHHLGITEDDENLITITALLHDIGHGPYSHATEPLMEEFTGRSHHEMDHLILDGELGATLEDLGIQPKTVCSVIRGDHPLSGIIHGDLDVDRMDYLLRDAHYTGVPYGTVDVHRLIRHTIITDQGMALDENGINAAEALLIARTLMRPAVYFHHVSRIAETMVQYAAFDHLNAVGSGQIETLLAMDDAGFRQELLTSPGNSCRFIMHALYTRRLYKRALFVGKDQVNPLAMQAYTRLGDERRIGDEIAGICGIEPCFVLVDIPPFPVSMSMEVQVKNRHDLVELEEFSSLMRALNETRREQWRIGVYTIPEHRALVEETATEVLHIKKPTKQDKLTI